jgi:hypothetical protein
MKRNNSGDHIDMDIATFGDSASCKACLTLAVILVSVRAVTTASLSIREDERRTITGKSQGR